MKTALYHIRMRCNYSQSMTARIIGISRQALSMWENGEKTIPEKRKAELAALFGIDAGILDEQDAEKIAAFCDRAVFSRSCEGKQVFSFCPAEDRPRIFLGMPQEKLPAQSCQDMMAHKTALLERVDHMLRFEFDRQVEQMTQMNQMITLLERMVGILDCCNQVDEAHRGRLLRFLSEQMGILSAVLGIEDSSHSDDKWNREQEHLLRFRLGQLNRSEKRAGKLLAVENTAAVSLMERAEYWYQYMKQAGISSSELQWYLNQLLEQENHDG